MSTKFGVDFLPLVHPVESYPFCPPIEAIRSELEVVQESAKVAIEMIDKGLVKDGLDLESHGGIRIGHYVIHRISDTMDSEGLN